MNSVSGQSPPAGGAELIFLVTQQRSAIRLIAGSGAMVLGLAGCGQNSTSSSLSVEVGARNVTTPLGTYDVPTEPSRVFAVDSRVDLETALALGFDVVATTLRAPAPWVPAQQGVEVLDGPVVLDPMSI